VETYRGTVYPWQVDHMGHMNVQFYVSKFDSATWQLFGAVGLTREWLNANSRGMAAVEQTINYSAELMPGDLVVVQSTVIAITARTLRFRHVMMNCVSNEEAASTELVAVHMDLVDRSSHPFPDSIREQVEEMIVSNADR